MVWASGRRRLMRVAVAVAGRVGAAVKADIGASKGYGILQKNRPRLTQYDQTEADNSTWRKTQQKSLRRKPWQACDEFVCSGLQGANLEVGYRIPRRVGPSGLHPGRGFRKGEIRRGARVSWPWVQTPPTLQTLFSGQTVGNPRELHPRNSLSPGRTQKFVKCCGSWVYIGLNSFSLNLRAMLPRIFKTVVK